MNKQIDVSLVINLHNEGSMALDTIVSAQKSIDFACSNGIRVELIIVMDDPSLETREICKQFNNYIVAECYFKDLGLSRNEGVKLSSGKYVAFLDGDDLCNPKWITRGYFRLEEEDLHVVVRPKYCMFFGKRIESFFWEQVDTRGQPIRLGRILNENIWVSTVMASRNLFEKIPFRRNDIHNGIGYEDWAWSIETLLHGVHHLVEDETIVFVRVKDANSLVSDTKKSNAIPNIIDYIALAIKDEGIDLDAVLPLLRLRH